MIAEWDLLRGGTMIGMDTATGFYPWYSFLGDRLRSGHIPGWNPHQFSGAPFAADPESGWMYLPAMLLFTILPLDAAARGYMLLHLLLAGLSVYALARALGMVVAGALLAATAYAYTGFLYGHHVCCFAYAGVASWLPLMLLGTELAIRARQWPIRGLWWGVAGVGLSQILAVWVGQGSYYALLVLGGYLVYRTLLLPPSIDRRIAGRFRNLVVHGGGVLLFGFALAAAGLLPRLEYNALSNLPGGYPRAVADVDGSTTMVWDLLRRWGLLLLVPGFHYLGGATLVLALVAPLVARARFVTPYFAALSLLVPVLASEGPTPLHSALSLLPGFERLHPQSSGRVLMVFYLGPALLAGATLTCLWKRGLWERGPWERGMKAALLALLPAVVTLWIADTLPAPPTPLLPPMLATGLVATCALLPTQRPLLSALLLLVVWADLLPAGQAAIAEGGVVEGAYQLRRVDLATHYAPTGAGRFLQSQGRPEEFRYFGYAQHVFGVPFPYTLRWADPGMTALEVNNRAMLSGLHDVQGYNPIHVARYDEYVAALNGRSQDYHHADVFEEGLSSTLLDLLNARYIVVPAVRASDQTAPRLDRAYPAVYEDEQVRVLENPHALPRAWIVHSAQVVGPGEAARLLAAGGVDPKSVALLEQPPPSLAQPDDPSAEAAAITAYDADRIALRVNTQAPGLLVLSEVYYPAWKAYVDDRPVPLYAANHALRAVPLPAGEHIVELRYESTALMVGLAISLSAYAALAALLVAAWSRTPSRAARSSTAPITSRLRLKTRVRVAPISHTGRDSSPSR